MTGIEKKKMKERKIENVLKCLNKMPNPVCVCICMLEHVYIYVSAQVCVLQLVLRCVCVCVLQLVLRCVCVCVLQWFSGVCPPAVLRKKRMPSVAPGSLVVKTSRMMRMVYGNSAVKYPTYRRANQHAKITPL